MYSFGVVAWELVSRKCPFETMSGVQVAMAVLRDGARPTIPESTPSAYAALIRACWAQDPKDRPAFDEVLRRLDAM